MNVYEEDSDSFSKEYLDYLKTLTTKVSDAKVRMTRNPQGQLIRFEVWVTPDDGNLGESIYYNFPLPGWMNP